MKNIWNRNLVFIHILLSFQVLAGFVKPYFTVGDCEGWIFHEDQDENHDQELILAELLDMKWVQIQILITDLD